MRKRLRLGRVSKLRWDSVLVLVFLLLGYLVSRLQVNILLLFLSILLFDLLGNLEQKERPRVTARFIAFMQVQQQ